MATAWILIILEDSLNNILRIGYMILSYFYIV